MRQRVGGRGKRRHACKGRAGGAGAGGADTGGADAGGAETGALFLFSSLASFFFCTQDARQVDNRVASEILESDKTG